jgi:uncharacterized OB-fold protein
VSGAATGPDRATAVFLDGIARGELLARRCPDGHWNEPSAPVCSACGSTGLGWAPASGRATLVSWAVVHDRDGSGAASEVVGIVELAEGPWLWVRVEATDPGRLEVGLPLSVRFAQLAHGAAVPVFSPDPDAGSSPEQTAP